MANFPTATDTTSTLPNVGPNAYTNNPDHSLLHNNTSQAVIAVETKLGIGASTPIANLPLVGGAAGSSSFVILPTAGGGTGSSTTAGARSNLSAAKSGANSDITSLTGLTTPLSVAQGGTGSTTTAAIAILVGNLLFPVGCIYTSVSSTNPATSLGFGTWTAFGGGRVLVGNGTSDQAFAAGATGGESNHTLSTGEMPAHTHGTVTGSAGGTGYVTGGGGNPFLNAGNTGSAGGGGAHNNLQPYIVVYFWQRTA